MPKYKAIGWVVMERLFQHWDSLDWTLANTKKQAISNYNANYPPGPDFAYFLKKGEMRCVRVYVEVK